MKVRDCHIARYDWDIQIYYAVTCYYIEDILKSLALIDCPEETISRVRDKLQECRLDTGITYSNKFRRKTVMVIGLHSSPGEFMNSLEHELRHLVDDIATTMPLDLSGERVAYLTGDINSLLWEDIHFFTCCKCRKHE